MVYDNSIQPLIQEAHPLKQGLKHDPCSPQLPQASYSRGTSTKTRIETSTYLSTPIRCVRSRIIQEAHPLKQGLKLTIALIIECYQSIQEAHPLKQGLKLDPRAPAPPEILIQEAHPLKQGLKPNTERNGHLRQKYSRGTSTKTRIETHINNRNTIAIIVR